jgi:hypothetical protein
MDWKEVGKKVAVAAPALGMAMAGPGGAAVGAMVAAAFGVEGNPDSVASVVSSPDAAVRLRELELRNAEVLASLAVQQIQAELNDVQNARTIHRDHWMPSALTIGLAAMVAGMVAALMLIDTPKSNESVIYLIAGQLIGAFATAVAYWLGSSRGSVNKQRALEARQ